MKKHHRHENDCLNCGTELQGHFCHSCGQENLHVKEPIWHFLSHSISHYFHFDSKFFTTLKPLLTQPGQLTLDYLAGRRTRYLHPVSMYIFVSIVYFLIIPHLNKKEHGDKDEDKAAKTEEIHYQFPADDSVKAVEKKLDKVPMGSFAKKGIEKSMLETKMKARSQGFKLLSFPAQTHIIDSLSKQNKLHPADSTRVKLNYFNNIHIERQDSTYESYIARQAKLPEEDQDNIFDRWSMRKDIKIKQKTNKDWDMDKEIEHYQPKLYFILMPVFAFFLMLNFRKNHRFYVEHIVFTIQCFTAFFIFEIVVQPINHFIFHDDSWIWKTLMWAVIAWYAYKALMLFYQRPRGVTIRKMITLFMMYFVAFGISYEIIYMVVYLSA